jgi:hypothetical protein
MIEELARHGYRISPGSLYPVLHGLEEKGYLRSSEQRAREVNAKCVSGHAAWAQGTRSREDKGARTVSRTDRRTYQRMIREQIQSYFEDLHRRIEHAIIEYEDATGQEVGDIAISRAGEEVQVVIRPTPR